MSRHAAPLLRSGAPAPAPRPPVPQAGSVAGQRPAGILPRHRLEDLSIEPGGEAPVQLARKGRRRRKRPKPQPAPTRPAAADPDDRTLSFRDLPPGPLRAYRMEASTQQYDDPSGRPKWAHFHVNAGGNSHLYLPKPTSAYSRPGYRERPADPRTTPKPRRRGLSQDDQSYAEGFLRNRRDTGRNTMFVNFAEPKRALELYRQKKANEPHLNFTIKSTLVPHSTFDELRRQTVHEADAQKYPTRPFNVDRKAPNQLGLRERHIDLLNSTALPGSARVENIARLERRYGPALDAAERAAAPKQEPRRGRYPSKGKRTRARTQPVVSHLPDPMEDEDDDDLPDLPRPRGARLGDFLSPRDRKRFGYDPYA